MKHVQDYYSYITEGKKQYQVLLEVGKDFNPFDLLNELKPLGAEVLSNEQKKKDQVLLTIAMDDSKRTAVEKKIAETAKILEMK